MPDMTKRVKKEGRCQAISWIGTSQLKIVTVLS